MNMTSDPNENALAAALVAAADQLPVGPGDEAAVMARGHRRNVVQRGVTAGILGLVLLAGGFTFSQLGDQDDQTLVATTPDRSTVTTLDPALVSDDDDTVSDDDDTGSDNDDTEDENSDAAVAPSTTDAAQAAPSTVAVTTTAASAPATTAPATSAPRNTAAAAPAPDRVAPAPGEASTAGPSTTEPVPEPFLVGNGGVALALVDPITGSVITGSELSGAAGDQDRLRLVSMGTKSSVAGTVTAVGLGTDPDGFCIAPLLDVGFEGPWSAWNRPIAIGGDHDPLPRSVSATSDLGGISVPDSTRSRIAGQLAALGIDDSRPKVIQLVRADLDADGNAEVLWAAERLTYDNGSPRLSDGRSDDYSVVGLWSEGPVAADRILSENVAIPGETVSFVSTARIRAVAEIGDGSPDMEIFVETAYYEGGGTEIYRWDGARSNGIELLADEVCGA